MLRHFRSLATTTASEVDLSELERGRQAIRLVRAFEDNASTWFWETDGEGRLSYLSPRAQGIFDQRGTQTIGRALNDVFQMDADSTTISRTIAFHLKAKSSFNDFPVRGVDQPHGCPWSISGFPKHDAAGLFTGFVGHGTDLTEKRRSEDAIAKLAYSDSLTGLANRQRMKSALEALLLSRTSGFQPTALLLLDLDRFKSVNDTLGHQVGDELLKQVAQRLTQIVGANGLVGRLGGDEFEIVIASDNARQHAEHLAERIIHSLSQPYFAGNVPITIGCSVGIAVAPEDGNEEGVLVRNADLALYAAKDAGRGMYKAYTSTLLAAATRRKALEDDLRQAVVEGALTLAYQPVVTTTGARIVGYEALLRWNHPVHGPISPADFVPIAEESGLIEALGEWVLRTAVQDASSWPHDIRVAVNVSPIQFANPRLASIVTNALAMSGLAPERLELEITEGVFLDETTHSDRMFQMLKGIGVRLALDDFGTGYSSLGYLKSAPFDKIKIDQSFVRGAIMPGNRNAAIIRAIVTLADVLGMETTAEGVEQQDEIDFVRDLGCSHIQGFVYGRPVPLAEVMVQLSGLDPIAKPIGHKVSRPHRDKVIQAARIKLGDISEDVVIRDISLNGAMIEGYGQAGLAIGMDVLIELLDGEVRAANVRWVDGVKAGVHFPRPLERARPKS